MTEQVALQHQAIDQQTKIVFVRVFPHDRVQMQDIFRFGVFQIQSDAVIELQCQRAGLA
ncbi:hypothetical protein D3C72_2131950 [compost metagenome]